MKLKLIGIAAAVVMATNAVQAQEDTIYVKSNSATYWHTAKPFKNVHVGNDKLLSVNPGGTNQDLVIVANRPEKDSLIDSSDVLVTDDQGNVVDKMHVEVTPFEAPSRTVTIMRPSDRFGNDATTVSQCSSSRCVTISGPQNNNGMGDADAVSATNFRDGSSIVTKSWRFKP